MADEFFSQSWHRVARLRPRLRAHSQVHRHRYRGESWYVLEDRSSGRVHRFTPAAWFVLGMMDGDRTLDEIWRLSVDRLGDDAPTQDELIQLVAQLHGVDMIQAEVAPDAAELLERFGRLERGRRMSGLRNPLAIRIPLWDPNAFLDRTIAFVRPLCGPLGLVVWLMLVVPASLLVAQHWDGLTSNFGDRVLSAGNLLVLILVFPLVKLLHELGHAWLTKSRGGEVHEMGVMLLVFMPLPYVDSSSANGFRSKWSRALVGSGGMLVETAIASLAVFGWVLVEPGLARAILFNVIVIAGVSTIVFNINPLLKYDGYYILCDLIEIPNLAMRSTRYWGWLIERNLFRMPSGEPFRIGAREKGWLVAYAPVSWAYRLIVLLSIALFVATEYLFVGVVLAVWGLALTLVWPIVKGLGQVFFGSRLQARRPQAVGATVAVIAAIASAGLLVPVPHHSNAEGVVWLPEDAQVRALATGFVTRVTGVPGSRVRAGDLVARADEPTLAAQVRVFEARVEELELRLASQAFSNRAEAELTRRALVAERAALERARAESVNLDLRSKADGTLVVQRAEDLPGRFLQRGQLVAWVTQDVNRMLRVVVPQEDIELVRQRLLSARVRLAPYLAASFEARIVREVPAAQEELPSRALAAAGGGGQAADPRDPDGVRTFERLFQFDLELPEDVPPAPLGSRAFVRFEFAPEPLAMQLWRRVRQLFLSRFDV